MCYYSEKFDFKPAEEDIRVYKKLAVRKAPNGVWMLYSPYQDMCYGELFDKNRRKVIPYGEMPTEEHTRAHRGEWYVIADGVLHSYHPAYAAYKDGYNLFPAVIPKGTLYMTDKKEMVSRALKITGIPRLNLLLHSPKTLSFEDKIDLIWNYFIYKLKGGK